MAHYAGVLDQVIDVGHQRGVVAACTGHDPAAQGREPEALRVVAQV